MSEKNFCFNCEKSFIYILKHLVTHKNLGEDCVISDEKCKIYFYPFSEGDNPVRVNMTEEDLNIWKKVR